MMNKVMGEAIGAEIGEFMDVETQEDGSAVGRVLRMKVHLDVRKPLTRGVMLRVEEKDGVERPLWCPVASEYLPDFCYTCGIIGHIDKVCEKKLQKGEVQQFNKT
jgi:uncharacterized protein involved in high-affinity Fe2+ transport